MRLRTTLFVALNTLALSAQIGRKELRTDSGLVVLHHFATGGISTQEWTDKDDRFGRSIAYDEVGREIFSYHTRRVGGHASAHFSYHPSGAISKVEVSDAPDGGIQWYRSTSTYDEAGNRTGFSEEGRDNYGPLHSPLRIDLPEPTPSEITIPPKQEVMECQQLFVNEVHIMNASSWQVEFNISPKDPSPALQASQFVLAPGQSKLVGTYSVGETFVSPVQRMSVVGTVMNKRGKKKQVGVLLMEQRQIDPQRKAWTYHVMPNGGRIGFGLR